MIAVVLLLSSVSLGIVGGTADYSDFTDPTSDWYGMSMDGIAVARSGSAVAVGNRWFLTARHFSLNVGNVLTMQDGSHLTITNTYTPLTPGSYVDLKLVRVAEEVDSWYDLYNIYQNPYATGEPVIIAGTGYTGTTGPGDKFTWSDTTTRDWRWGTNEITGYQMYDYSAYNSYCMQLNFDLGDTDYESGLGSGDSGGGMFVKNPSNGEWELVGISAYIDAREKVYDTNYALWMTQYSDWVHSIVPTGDLDDTDTLTVEDIDLLFSVINTLGGATPAGYELYDVNSDGVLDEADRDFMIRMFFDTEYGDINLDGKIDLIDVGIFGDNYGLSGSWAQGDFNGDGVVDLIDLGLIGDGYGFDNTVVPEPASLSLLAIGGLAILRRKRQR